MAEVIPDWERSDDSHLGTYKGVMRLRMVSTVAIIVVLILMALFLL